jgi:peptide chain release factor
MIRLLFTSGRGPAECRIAVRKAVATLAAEAAVLGLETDCLEGPNTDGHGPASAIVVIHGDAAAAFAGPWIGAIQWVAQSPLRPHHKRKNWFIGVFELPALPDAPKALAVQDVRFEAFRAGGPGGQHQNKTESAVRATHIASGLSSWREKSARNIETRRWHWSGSRRYLSYRVSCKRSPRRTMRMQRMIASSADGR